MLSAYTWLVTKGLVSIFAMLLITLSRDPATALVVSMGIVLNPCPPRYSLCVQYYSIFLLYTNSDRFAIVEFCNSCKNRKYKDIKYLCFLKKGKKRCWYLCCIITTVHIYIWRKSYGKFRYMIYSNAQYSTDHQFTVGSKIYSVENE